MAELYLLFKYLRPNKMKETRITSFDRWAANFANDYSDLEYYMGRFKEVHRFREFANLPELLTLY
jgi:N12 class adenine-specific DNA methylase